MSTYLSNEQRIKLQRICAQCEATKNREELLSKIDELRNELSFQSQESYGLFWPGKAESIEESNREPEPATFVHKPDDGIGTCDDLNTVQHAIIESDNLIAMKHLLPILSGRVKLIYIDPPYNTRKSAFAYHDDYSESVKDLSVRIGYACSESARYHSGWLSMMYPRIKVAKKLLSDDGVILVSIDDNESHHLRQIMDEVFGERNFIAQLVWESGCKNDTRYISVSHEYILVYAKNIDTLKEQQPRWRVNKDGLIDIYAKYDELKTIWGDNYAEISAQLRAWYRNLGKEHPSYSNKHYCKVDAFGIYFSDNISRPAGNGAKYTVLHPVTQKPCSIPIRGWVYGEETMNTLISKNMIEFGDDEKKVPCVKRYLHETEKQVMKSVFYQDVRGAKLRLQNIMKENVFEYPKDENILAKIFRMITNDSDIILDFFAGSGTTMQSVMQLNAQDGGNRRCIMIQIPEEINPKSISARQFLKRLGKPSVISEITKERIRRVIKKLSDKPSDLFSVPAENNTNLQFSVFQLISQK